MAPTSPPTSPKAGRDRGETSPRSQGALSPKDHQPRQVIVNEPESPRVAKPDGKGKKDDRPKPSREVAGMAAEADEGVPPRCGKSIMLTRRPMVPHGPKSGQQLSEAMQRIATGQPGHDLRGRVPEANARDKNIIRPVSYRPSQYLQFQGGGHGEEFQPAYDQAPHPSTNPSSMKFLADGGSTRFGNNDDPHLHPIDGHDYPYDGHDGNGHSPSHQHHHPSFFNSNDSFGGSPRSQHRESRSATWDAMMFSSKAEKSAFRNITGQEPDDVTPSTEPPDDREERPKVPKFDETAAAEARDELNSKARQEREAAIQARIEARANQGLPLGHDGAPRTGKSIFLAHTQRPLLEKADRTSPRLTPAQERIARGEAGYNKEGLVPKVHEESEIPVRPANYAPKGELHGAYPRHGSIHSLQYHNSSERNASHKAPDPGRHSIWPLNRDDPRIITDHFPAPAPGQSDRIRYVPDGHGALREIPEQRGGVHGEEQARQMPHSHATTHHTPEKPPESKQRAPAKSIIRQGSPRTAKVADGPRTQSDNSASPGPASPVSPKSSAKAGPKAKSSPKGKGKSKKGPDSPEEQSSTARQSVAFQDESPTEEEPHNEAEALHHAIYKFDGDYETIVGENKEKFMEEATEALGHFGVKCVDARPGSIIAELEGNPAALKEALSSIDEKGGLELPSFGNLAAVGEEGESFPVHRPEDEQDQLPGDSSFVEGNEDDLPVVGEDGHAEHAPEHVDDQDSPAGWATNGDAEQDANQPRKKAGKKPQPVPAGLGTDRSPVKLTDKMDRIVKGEPGVSPRGLVQKVEPMHPVRQKNHPAPASGLMGEYPRQGSIHSLQYQSSNERAGAYQAPKPGRHSVYPHRDPATVSSPRSDAIPEDAPMQARKTVVRAVAGHTQQSSNSPLMGMRQENREKREARAVQKASPKTSPR